MKTDSLRLTAVIPARPDVVQAAWLDGALHTAMTGAPATGEARVGARFTAWEDYIEGENLEVEAGHIVQSWRSSQFPPGAPNSRVEILFGEAVGGTELTLTHTNIPLGQGDAYEDGWEEFYFTPMRAYFGAAT